jgi:hypothetical protein
MRSQATDYALRGTKAETMNLIEFFVGTWETKASKDPSYGDDTVDGDENRRPGRKHLWQIT